MRKVVQLLQETVPPALAQTVSGSPNYHLLTDGRALEASPHEVVDLVKNSRQPMFAICLSDTVREVKALVGGGKRPGRCRPEKARSMRKAKFG
jgi:hypothetical protein